MRAVSLCHSALFGAQPHYLGLSSSLKRSASIISPQKFTPALWPTHRPFHNNHYHYHYHHQHCYNYVKSRSTVRFKQPRHASFGWGIVGIACVIGGAAAFRLFYVVSEKEPSPKVEKLHSTRLSQKQIQDPRYIFTGIIDSLEMSSQEIPTGHLGNLTAEQEAKLREMWTVLFSLFGIKIDSGKLEKTPTALSESPDEKKKSRRSFFGFGGGGGGKKEEPASTPDVAGLSLSDHDDKYGQNKEFKQAIADLKPEQLRDSLWSMLKADHPDALLLRFLRARKWDVNKAVVMLISTIRWRLVDMHVDDDVMEGGEEKAMMMAESSGHETKKLGADFMAQTRMGKSFIHGVDKQGRPICYIRVKLHKIGVHSEKSTERYTVHMIETARLMLPRPVETAVIMFDMTGFTLSNMDYAPVKFIIKCFEANYPESLGAILIHQAPWIFSGIWKIIRGWLDPVVAAKVHFTNTTEDLEVFIDRSRILKDYGGEDGWVWEYVEPKADENAAMKDTTKRDEAISKQKALAQEIQDATKSWIEAANKGDDAGVASWKSKREELTTKYSHGYWETDPYIRARSVYDRNGVILGGGKIQFYPERGADSEIKLNTAPFAEGEVNKQTETTNGVVPATKAEVDNETPAETEEKTDAVVTVETNGVDVATPAVPVSAN